MQSPKNSVNHNEGYYWDHPGLGAAQETEAWKKGMRNSISTFPNKIWCICPFSISTM